MVHNNKGNALRNAVEVLSGMERAKRLRQAVACYDAALGIYSSEETPDDWALAHNNKGNALHDLVGLLGNAERAEILREVLVCFDAALTVYTRERTPADWAIVQNNKGVALRDLAGTLKGMERTKTLRQAITFYNQALKERRREGAPTEWAMTQCNRGNALRDLAGLLEGEERAKTLHQAIACYEDALLERRHEVIPIEWAATQNNKGNALDDLARSSAGKESRETLREAIVCYDKALLEWNRELTPTSWAMTQYNKAGTLANLAQVLEATERMETLRQALTYYDAALALYTHDEAPAHWAMVQHDKGTALSDLAELLEGMERAETLHAALACYDAALAVSTRESVPVHWAKAQNNKGIALCRLAELLEVAERGQMLHEAIACYDTALSVYTRGEAPTNWAATQDNKGNALSALAQVLEGRARVRMLRTAIACYDSALSVYTYKVTPVDWAMVETNKGNALRDLADSLEHTRRETLHDAIACYDSALSVYTREVLPVNHHRVAQAVGILLFEEGDWEQATHYLAKALDALDDLFTLEVTARGRQATLKVGGDLTEHLAYALARTGRADSARQAAEALERGRARATGEAIARQEAQLEAAELLAPDLLRAFRQASDRLAAVALIGHTARTSPSLIDTTETMGAADTSGVLERPGRRALNMQLAGYEEAKEARKVYDTLVEHIRETLPDFLKRDVVLDAAGKVMAPDERLVYLASTPIGATILLVSSSRDDIQTPIVECLWDEQLKSFGVARLLIGSSDEEREQQVRSTGLLAAQSHQGRLREALRVTMQTLGVPNGVLARLVNYCRIASIRRLVLVPCGLLGLLPLHAALVPSATQDGGLEPLLDAVQVSYAPSARIWTACRKRATSYRMQRADALIVGDPQPHEHGVRPLPGAKHEALRISKMVTQNAHGQVSGFEGEAATLADVLKALQSRSGVLSHIHLACHGVVELTNPYASGLLLAYSARLMMRDVLDPAVLRFGRLRLAVLSACGTALPGTDLPDEVVGLPSGWLQAGAIGVLASLWPLSDSKTVVLMTKFYELHLLDRLDPVEALWLAQRWLRRLPS
jgi:tetratricopeptide (TPR) repeat protein